MSSLKLEREPGRSTAAPAGIGAIVAVSAVLVAVYTLPDPLRLGLRFEYADPTLSTAYTAHFVHLSASHLLGNLAAFAVVATTVYYLSSRAERSGAFLRLVATLFVAFPVALSGLNLAVPRDGVMYGFSGLNMALVGFLPAVIATYVGRRRNATVDGTALLVAFFGSVAYVAAVGTPRSMASDAIAIAAAASAAAIGVTRYRSSPLPSVIPSAFHPADADIPAVVGIAVWIAFLSVGFPETVVENERVTNIYVHFLGYALGFMTAYLAYEWRLFE